MSAGLAVISVCRHPECMRTPSRRTLRYAATQRPDSCRLNDIIN